MGADRSRIAVWCCVFLAVLTVSGCFLGPSTPTKPSTKPSAWVSVETTAEVSDVVIEKVTYRSGDLNIRGQVCRPAGDGRYPVLIANHGGFGGLPDWNNSNGLCARTAKSGWVVAESSYRGENGSDGQIEVCLGEVDDVLAMLDVVRTQSYADPKRIAMIGLSHGGCVTSRAVALGADVDVAIDLSGPTDWNTLMPGLKRSSKNPSVNPVVRKIQASLVQAVENAVGGTPKQFPEQYAMRSPAARKIARWDKPFLIMHGSDDSIVPVKQSCDLARKIGGFRAYRFDASGGVVAKAPPGCEDLAWKGPPTPVRKFPANRYLLVYDEVGHVLTPNGGLTLVTSDFLAFLKVKLLS